MLFTAFAFSLLSAPDTYIQHLGVYLIADGGYQAWRVLQMTFKYAICPHLTRLYACVLDYFCVMVVTRSKVC